GDEAVGLVGVIGLEVAAQPRSGGEQKEHSYGRTAENHINQIKLKCDPRVVSSTEPVRRPRGAGVLPRSNRRGPSPGRHRGGVRAWRRIRKRELPCYRGAPRWSAGPHT